MVNTLVNKRLCRKVYLLSILNIHTFLMILFFYHINYIFKHKESLTRNNDFNEEIRKNYLGLFL